jgi:hypothetical protein
MNEKTVQISSRYFPKYFAVGQIVGETHASPDWICPVIPFIMFRTFTPAVK